MSEKKRRSWTASEKLRIVLAGVDGSVEISELARRDPRVDDRRVIRPMPLQRKGRSRRADQCVAFGVRPREELYLAVSLTGRFFVPTCHTNALILNTVTFMKPGMLEGVH